MIKIAILSDIHFGKNSRSKEFAIPGQNIVDEAIGGASLYGGLEQTLRQHAPDYIFCPGDLTSSGNPLEFKLCLEKIYGLAENVGVKKENVLYCYGNHDVNRRITDLSKSSNDLLNRDPTDVENAFVDKYYYEMSHMWLCNANFVDNVSAYNSYFSASGPVSGAGIFVRDNMEVYLLNSGLLCTSEQEIRHGKITQLQTKWLEDELKKRSEESNWKIVMLHHQPFNYPFPTIGLDVSTLEEGAELTELCSQFGVHLVIHGHRHHPRAKTRIEGQSNKPTTYISAGSLSVNSYGRANGQIPNTFHLIELLDDNKYIKLTTYEYQLGAGWTSSIQSRAALPLEHEMYFGMETINHTRAKELIKLFPRNQAIFYDEIEIQLKSLPITNLNNLLEAEFKLQLSGSFPSAIMIHSEKDEV